MKIMKNKLKFKMKIMKNKKIVIKNKLKIYKIN